MTHFTVVVCVKDPDDLEQALAPFDQNREVPAYRDYEDGSPSGFWATGQLREDAGLNPDDSSLTWAQVAEAFNRRYPDEAPLLVAEDGRAYTMSTYNTDAEWDCWTVGGRWDGYFIYRQEFASSVFPSKHDPDAPGRTRGLRCNGGPKAALDLGALRDDVAARARATYAEWQTVTAGTPDALPWSTFAENISEGNGYTIDQARRDYHAQPRVQAYQKTHFQLHDDPIETFGVPEAQYAARARAAAVPGYATLTVDGRWMAPGRVGAFAASSDREGDRIGYWEAANAYIDGLADDVYLIAVDCHI